MAMECLFGQRSGKVGSVGSGVGLVIGLVIGLGLALAIVVIGSRGTGALVLSLENQLDSGLAVEVSDEEFVSIPDKL